MALTTLSDLLDLAIGTPEVGAVNFNVLYRLLKAMINKLDLRDFEIDISDIDRSALGGAKFLTSSETKYDSPYHQLEKKVSFVYNQIEQFQSLPSTKQLSSQLLGDHEDAVSNMWQYMRLKKKVETNEEGIEKLMSMVGDLMKQIDYLQTSNTELLKRLENLDLQNLTSKFDELSQLINNLSERGATQDDLNNFVTWNYLENALNGLARPKASTTVGISFGYVDNLLQMKPEDRHNFIEDVIKDDLIHKYFPRMEDAVLQMSTEDRKNYFEESIENGNIGTLLAQSGTDLLKMNPKERSDFIDDAIKSGSLRAFLPGLDRNFELLDLEVRNKIIEDSIKDGVFHKFLPCKFQCVGDMNIVQRKASIACALSHRTLEEFLPGVSEIENQSQFIDRAAHEGIIEVYEEITGSEAPPLSNIEQEIEKEIIKECQLLMYEDNGTKETELAMVSEPQEESKEKSIDEEDSRPKQSAEIEETPDRAKQGTPEEKPKRWTPLSRPQTGRPWSSASAPGLNFSTINMGPSPDLVDVLGRLGKLYDYHNRLVLWVKDVKAHLKLKADDIELKELEERVQRLEELLKTKLEKGDLDGLSGLIETMQDEIESIKELLNEMSRKEPMVVKSSLPDIGQMVENRLSDSRAFAELLDRLGVLEGKITDFQDSLKRRDSAYSSEYSFLQDSMSEISSDLDVGRRRKKKKEKPQPVEDDRFANVIEGTITHDIIKMITDTMETGGQDVGDRLKRLGLILDDQLGEVKDKIEILDEDLKLMAKGVEVALQKAKDLEDAGRQAASSKTPDESLNIDSEALLETQKILQFIQQDIAKLHKTTGDIIQVNNQKQKEIEQLYEHKADKDFVLGEFDVKADKRQLEGKVNFSFFNKTTDEINKTIKEFEAKLEGNELAMQHTFEQLTEDVDGKLDRLEMDPLKGWIESRIKELNKKIAKSQPGWTDDDAAGLRKQLIQRFHCLSCDKTVNMMSKDPVPSLPKQSGLSVTRSARPYTIFELDQIRLRATKGIINQSMLNFERALMERQLARIKKSDLKAFLVHYSDQLEALGMKREVALAENQENNDTYARSRACGGLHTMTFPHRRLIKTNKTGDDEGHIYRQCGEESDVQGADGVIYKGRSGYTEPGHGPKGMKVLRKNTPSSNSQSASSSRPGSARNKGPQRPASARPGSRPTSACPNSVKAVREEDESPLNVPVRVQKSENV